MERNNLKKKKIRMTETSRMVCVGKKEGEQSRVFFSLHGWLVL